MAKTSSPSQAPRNAPHRKAHRYIDALVSDDFGRLAKLTIHSAHGFAKKKLDAASQSLRLRNERQERKARRIEVREWRAAERSVAAELRESDHRTRLMWRSLKTRVRPEQKLQHTPKERRRHWPYALVALPKYDGPVIDRQGQRGVFMRVRYYSRRSAEAGVSQRVLIYCFNGAELDPNGNPYVATNIGATIDEALCGFDHLEQVNWSAARNAKILMHGILAVDHRQSPDEMMTCGMRWAEETLGRFDLPYLVTLHAPPPDGDQRNWHLHVLWSFRPLVRTDDYEWQVGEMLRTDLDNPAAMKLFREMFAEMMTEMSFEAGQNQIWTAKSNVGRGLPHEPQVHLGEANTNRARSGEHIAENEENHERVIRSKAEVIDDTLRHADEALAKAGDAARAVAARFARLPPLPMRLPERIAAATMALEAPTFRNVPVHSAASIVVPAPLPPIRINPMRITGSIEPLRQPPRRSSVAIIRATPPRSLPHPARVEFANLRIPPLPMTKDIAGMTIPAPGPPPRTTAPAPALPALSKVQRLRLVPVDQPVATPPVIAGLSFPRLPGPASWQHPLPLADTAIIDHGLMRMTGVRRREDERCKGEREGIERAAQEARNAAERLQAIDRKLLAVDPPAAPKPRASAWQRARHLREQAMAEWDDIERVDQGGMARPGQMIARPGVDRAETGRPSTVRRMLGIRGPGIAD